MSIILSIETSTDICSVAIHKEELLQSYVELHISKSHSEKITLLIQQVLTFANININEIDAIALSKGPGSYTGLRVGTSTAKGLCMSLNVPLIGINTLQVMTAEVKNYINEDIYYCPMLDARRMEVYCAILDNSLFYVQPTEAIILEGTSFHNFLEKKSVVFFGNGAIKFETIKVGDKGRFIKNIYPKANFVGSLAYDFYKNQKFEDLYLFEPFYLKDFVSTKKD